MAEEIWACPLCAKKYRLPEGKSPPPCCPECRARLTDPESDELQTILSSPAEREPSRGVVPASPREAATFSRFEPAPEPTERPRPSVPAAPLQVESRHAGPIVGGGCLAPTLFVAPAVMLVMLGSQFTTLPTHLQITNWLMVLLLLLLLAGLERLRRDVMQLRAEVVRLRRERD